MDYIEKWPYMVIFQYNLYIFGIHVWTVLYPKPCYIEPCYKEVVVYMVCLVPLWQFYQSAQFAIQAAFITAVYKKEDQINIFLFFHENMCCGYSLEVPLQCASNETHNIIIFWWDIKKKIYMISFWLKKKVPYPELCLL